MVAVDKKPKVAAVATDAAVAVKPVEHKHKRQTRRRRAGSSKHKFVNAIIVAAGEIESKPGHEYIVKSSQPEAAEVVYTPFYKVGEHASHRIKCNKWKSSEKLDQAGVERQRRYTLKRIKTGLKTPYARGSKDEVYLGLALKTAGGVTRDGLVVNSKGRVVNLGRHTAGREAQH